MKVRLLQILLAFLCMGIWHTVNAGISYNGYVSTSLYSWEDANSTTNLDLYQGFYFKFVPNTQKKLYIKTYFRFARPGDDKQWGTKFYNGYVDWKTKNNRYHLRLGRQFTYYGVIRGSLDAISFSLRPASRLKLMFVAGSAVPFSQKLEFKKVSDNRAAGVFGSYSFSGLRTQLSYFQKSRNGQKIWQQAGLSVNGSLTERVWYTADAEFDILHTTYQSLRLRMDYYVDKWMFHGEISNQKPRLYEDFLYQIFEIEGFSQFRTGLSYSLNKYRLNLDYLLSVYGSNLSNRIITGISSAWGYLGLLLNLEDQGRNMGLVGNVAYPLTGKWTLVFRSSYYNYKRHLVSTNEEAAALSAGMDFKPVKNLSIGARFQETVNSYYKNDFRGLFRLKYIFRSTHRGGK